MTATLTFNLPEEQQEFRLASNAAELDFAIRDLEESIRLDLKHGHSFGTPDAVLEWVRTRLREALPEL